MAVQQCKKSKQKIRQRRSANRYKGFEIGKCTKCGAPAMPHRACKKCGSYKGKQVLDITAE